MEPSKTTFRVLLFGRTGVGKSTHAKACGATTARTADDLPEQQRLLSVTTGVDEYVLRRGSLIFYDVPGTGDIANFDGTGRDLPEIMKDTLKGLERHRVTHIDLIAWLVRDDKTASDLSQEARLINIICHGRWESVVVLGRVADGGSADLIAKARRGINLTLVAAREAAAAAQVERPADSLEFLYSIQQRSYSTYRNVDGPNDIVIGARYVRFGDKQCEPQPDPEQSPMADWFYDICELWARTFEINRAWQRCLNCFQGPMDRITMQPYCHSHARPAHPELQEHWYHGGKLLRCHGRRIPENNSTKLVPLLTTSGMAAQASAEALLPGMISPQLTVLLAVGACVWDGVNAWKASNNAKCEGCNNVPAKDDSNACLAYYACCRNLTFRNGEENETAGADHCPYKRRRFTCPNQRCQARWRTSEKGNDPNDEAPPEPCGYICFGPNDEEDSKHHFYDPNNGPRGCIDLVQTGRDHNILPQPDVGELNQGVAQVDLNAEG